MKKTTKAPTQQPLFDDVEHSAAGVTPGKKDKRWRGQFRFWLDANTPDEKALGEELMQLKSKRQFMPTIRNALRLFLDLRAGRTDVLSELFPGIVTALRQTPATASDEFELMIIKKMDEVQNGLKRLEAMPISATSSPANFTSAAPGPKALSVPKFDLPTFDNDDGDDLDTLVIKRDTSVNVAENFLSSLSAMMS